jgi:putative membrane protein
MAEPVHRPAAFSLGKREAIVEDDAFVAADGIVVADAPDFAEGQAEEPPPAEIASRRSGRAWSAMFWTGLAGLGSLAFGLAVSALIEALFARSTILGWVGAALLALLLIAGLALALRELRAIARLRHIDDLRLEAIEIFATDDRDRARKLVRELVSLYSRDPTTARARAELSRASREIVDGADLMRLAERELMTDLDARARRLVGHAATRVSAVTTIAPRAIIDIAVVAAVSVSLIRRVAEIYAGRPGRLGFFRLLRHVGSHLAVTGGMAAGEGVIDQLVGHGIAARLSAKLGEGMINGLLTARVGMAAIAVCRPLPFIELPQPTARDVAGSLFEKSGKAS